MQTDPIRNVSGTAFWIANYRAIESARAQPIFRDPWAARLAGDRGEQVTRQFWGARFNAWIWITRTAVIDRFVLQAVAERHIDTVINLGAGLDTRAFRLALPRTLRWFDVDKDEIVTHKRHVLRDASPCCDYRSVAADLGQDEARAAVLAEIASRGDKMLVLTEGLLEYLTPASVKTLARQLHAMPARSWICNLHSAAALARAKLWRDVLARVEAPVHFAPEDAPAFFLNVGWREVAWVSIIEQAMALNRMPGVLRPAIHLTKLAPLRVRQQISRFVGVARYDRVGYVSTSAPDHGSVV